MSFDKPTSDSPETSVNALDPSAHPTRARSGVAISLAALLLTATAFVPAGANAATSIVRPENLLVTPATGGWWFAEDSPSSGNASGSLSEGPAPTPAGAGSARMILDGGTAGRMLLGNSDYNGKKLSQLTSLSYDAVRTSADAGNLLAISLQINADYDLTDASTGWQGRLVFEPYFTVGSGTILEDTWYGYDPLDPGAKWYMTGNAFKGGVNVGNPCPQSSPCTLATILATFPDVGIHASLGAVQFKAGAPWPNFDGNVDNVRIAVSGGADTLFDFEAAKSCAAARYVAPSGTNAGSDCHDSGAPCLTVQYAVDQACPGETVNVAAGSYQEQVTIQQGLSLAGAGAGSTTLAAPPKSSRTIKSINHGLGTRNYDYQVGVFGGTNLEVGPASVPDEQPPRVNAGDAPTGFGPDSWQGPAIGKSNWHARYLADGNGLTLLFPVNATTMTIADLASISYFTKRPAGTPSGRDWWIQIYTRKTGSGDASSWYHARFINNYNDHTTTDSWTRYSTQTGMTFNLAAPAPAGPELTLAQLIASYGSQQIEMISVQTDSGWNGFGGYLDGLVVTLNSGNVGRVDFEAATGDPAADTASVSGFTLDGNLDAQISGPGSFRSHQIAFYNAGGSIADNTLLDWQDAAAFGVQGVASLVLGSATPVSVSVERNTISGYQKGGLVALGTAAVDVNVIGNTVAGAGPITTTAQNGIQVSNGATGTVEGNTVSGNNYTPASWCATGIMLLDADSALVRGNALDGNLCDLYAQTNGSTISGNNIPAALSYPFSVLGDDNVIDKNYVNGSLYDAIYNDGINNTYTCNRISNNLGNGIYFDSTEVYGTTPGTPNAATDNAITGNANGIDATAVVTLPVLNGRDNWWGCAAGANEPGCDTAVGNIDVTPAAAAEPDCVTCAGAGGDTDEDGLCDPVDNCPDVVNLDQADADADVIGDVCDACPNDAANDVDTDGVCGNVDNCPAAANADQANADADAAGDVCDNCPLDASNDIDTDGACANVDNCPNVSNADQADADADSVGNVCDACTDLDGDGFGTPGYPANTCIVDNCPSVSNASQADADADTLGDACDACPLDANNDSDADGKCANVDNCPSVSNAGQANADADALGDACDACPLDAGNDVDADARCANVDNCPSVSNASQVNADADAAGDACDTCTDLDGDGFGNPGYAANTCETDNCPALANADQEDTDGDGIGNVCDSNSGTGTMSLSRAQIQAAKPGALSGFVRLTGVIADEAAGGRLAEDLTASGDVRAEVTAGAFTTTIAFGTCTQQSERKILCKSTNLDASFKLLPQHDNVFPGTWVMKVTQKKVADSDLPTGPVVVELIQPTPSIRRGDTISLCAARPAIRSLSCREQ